MKGRIIPKSTVSVLVAQCCLIWSEKSVAFKRLCCLRWVTCQTKHIKLHVLYSVVILFVSFSSVISYSFTMWLYLQILGPGWERYSRCGRWLVMTTNHCALWEHKCRWATKLSEILDYELWIWKHQEHSFTSVSKP